MYVSAFGIRIILDSYEVGSNSSPSVFCQNCIRLEFSLPWTFDRIHWWKHVGLELLCVFCKTHWVGACFPFQSEKLWFLACLIHLDSMWLFQWLLKCTIMLFVFYLHLLFLCFHCSFLTFVLFEGWEGISWILYNNILYFLSEFLTRTSFIILLAVALKLTRCIFQLQWLVRLILYLLTSDTFFHSRPYTFPLHCSRLPHNTSQI